MILFFYPKCKEIQIANNISLFLLFMCSFEYVSQEEAYFEMNGCDNNFLQSVSLRLLVIRYKRASLQEKYFNFELLVWKIFASKPTNSTKTYMRDSSFYLIRCDMYN